ncbi:MAG TPA: methylated-DNA--[protein]-cysteine S-methyltransferase [Bryobacteraceae bacterium]|nr:methylated-DNA--[protein]-cysteine S-methyltransferase [Bryobacteraceae bacterium]
MSEVLKLFLDRIQTPIGEMLLVTDAAGKVRALDWNDYESRMTALLDRHYGKGHYTLEPAGDTGALRDIMRRYFAGEVEAIDGIATETTGTAFQKDVWNELRNIPVGTSISYGTLAKRIDRPKAVRAVGLANGSNPIGLIVPCHRVIGANGSLTGYGGGLERKKWLLEHERMHAKGASLFAA